MRERGGKGREDRGWGGGGWILSVIHNPASLTATAIEGGPIVILGPDVRYDISLGDSLAIPCITSDLSLPIVFGGLLREITTFVWGVNYEAPASFFICGVEGSFLFTLIETGKYVGGGGRREGEREGRGGEGFGRRKRRGRVGGDERKRRRGKEEERELVYLEYAHS